VGAHARTGGVATGGLMDGPAEARGLYAAGDVDLTAAHRGPEGLGRVGEPAKNSRVGSRDRVCVAGHDTTVGRIVVLVPQYEVVRARTIVSPDCTAGVIADGQVPETGCGVGVARAVQDEDVLPSDHEVVVGDTDRSRLVLDLRDPVRQGRDLGGLAGV